MQGMARFVGASQVRRVTSRHRWSLSVKAGLARQGTASSGVSSRGKAGMVRDGVAQLVTVSREQGMAGEAGPVSGMVGFSPDGLGTAG